MSHKKNAAANRDALFGGAGGGAGGPKHKKNAAANRNALFGDAGGGGAAAAAPPAKASSSVPSSAGYAYGGLKEKRDKNKKKASMLSPEARAAKLKEAEEYKTKAKKCMQSGLFKKPDPVMASTFYKRAADAYQVAGEERLERLYRVSSADCQLKVGAFATAAAEYTRAAELLMMSEEQEDTLDQKRRDGSLYHKKASEAYRQMNEPAKAAKSLVDAALAFLHQDTSDVLSRETLAGLEEAVESFVPDPLNSYCRYRQTGVSAFIDPDSDETAEKPSEHTLEMAKNHIVSRAYSHEPIWDVIYLFVGYGEYASALYAAGASSALLSRDGISTVTLARSYCMETILTLAMGDSVAAENEFYRHCGKSSYLNSRECKMSEELFRAIKTRDLEALEEVRSPEGSNRACLAHLHPAMRELVGILRISGVARRGAPPEVADKKASIDVKKADKALPSLAELEKKSTGYEGEEGANLNSGDLDAELDALNFGGDASEEELSDDDVDLR